MKSRIILLIGLLILGNNKAIGQTLEAKRKVIVLDAGHGGIDSGTVSTNGLQEKDIVLDIARSMITWNSILLESKYDIYLTRNKDTLISLDDRTRLVKHIKPDIFISLHCNHISDSNIKGVEVYTYDNNELSEMYAQTILNELNRNLGFMTRKPKEGNFQVLREIKEHCPAILLELGYLSNSSESNYLKDSQNRKALALAILMAI
ncbi:N-acetylmuramoyl-L-alanine amidase [Maribacter algarum]|uniref:N-acetylmuramoyl-L-alanine amidase n=1 Tax=Maribacter algarum (ex Zhang et al. 2020) TaxID=2578118 RepID=A0A5S3PMZ5_9FLAO|nr:N-acetylmuramoyl-L-alanine amidase [Maribacter algarum]TMM55844.1 N-acetylmuramoyl-L-alanine amidase [Maribacter algarum]